MATIELRGPHEASPVNIVADAVITSVGIGEGRMIPLLILDTTGRPDIEELVRVHEHISPGDVTFRWAELGGHKDTVSLILEFVRPSELTMILDFNIRLQGGLVDLILNSKAVYIQPGREGDRLRKTMDNPRILVEIGDTGFQKDWDKMLHKAIFREFRARGRSRSESKEATEGFLNQWRKFGNFRMKD